MRLERKYQMLSSRLLSFCHKKTSKLKLETWRGNSSTFFFLAGHSSRFCQIFYFMLWRGLLRHSALRRTKWSTKKETKKVRNAIFTSLINDSCNVFTTLLVFTLFNSLQLVLVNHLTLPIALLCTIVNENENTREKMWWDKVQSAFKYDLTHLKNFVSLSYCFHFQHRLASLTRVGCLLQSSCHRHSD